MTCVIAICFFPIGFYLGFHFLFRSPARSVTDVIALIRCVHDEELEDLSSDLIEENLRSSLPTTSFRAEQRRRTQLLFEYMRRMSFNSWILLSWAHDKHARLEGAGLLTDDVHGTIKEIIVSGTAYRIYSFLALAQLTGQLVLNLMHLRPVRGLAKLLRIRKQEGLIMYRDLTSAAVRLAAWESAETQSRLAASLFGRFV